MLPVAGSTVRSPRRGRTGVSLVAVQAVALLLADPPPRPLRPLNPGGMIRAGGSRPSAVMPGRMRSSAARSVGMARPCRLLRASEGGGGSVRAARTKQKPPRRWGSDCRGMITEYLRQRFLAEEPLGPVRSHTAALLVWSRVVWSRVGRRFPDIAAPKGRHAFLARLFPGVLGPRRLASRGGLDRIVSHVRDGRVCRHGVFDHVNER